MTPAIRTRPPHVHHRSDRLPVPDARAKRPDTHLAFLEVTVSHLDAWSLGEFATLTRRERYATVARELGGRLFRQHLERRALVAADDPRWSELASTCFDADGRFDHVACHLHVDGVDPMLCRVDTFFYRGDLLVATSAQRGRFERRWAPVADGRERPR